MSETGRCCEAVGAAVGGAGVVAVATGVYVGDAVVCGRADLSKRMIMEEREVVVVVRQGRRDSRRRRFGRKQQTFFCNCVRCIRRSFFDRTDTPREASHFFLFDMHRRVGGNMGKETNIQHSKRLPTFVNADVGNDDS